MVQLSLVNQPSWVQISNTVKVRFTLSSPSEVKSAEHSDGCRRTIRISHSSKNVRYLPVSTLQLTLTKPCYFLTLNFRPILLLLKSQWAAFGFERLILSFDDLGKLDH